MSLKTTLFVLAAFTAYTTAITPEEKAALQTLISPILAECSSKFDTSEGDIEAAKAANDGGNLKPCFIGCFFKKVGIINEEGNFDTEEAKSKAKEFFKSGDDLSRVEEITETCKSINDVPVPDGAEGCERAKLLMECFTKNKGQLAPF